jgi:hypothetical protein
MSFATVPEILDEIRAGRMVVIVDDEDRENEGDLIMAAEKVRPEDVNFMVREGRGLVCLPLTEKHCRQLGLKPMVDRNTSPHHTNFTVSIGPRAASRPASPRTTARTRSASPRNPTHGPTTSCSRATFFRSRRKPAACSRARATPKPRSISRRWQVWRPRACSSRS